MSLSPPGPSLRWKSGSSPLGKRSRSTRALMLRIERIMSAGTSSGKAWDLMTCSNSSRTAGSPATGLALIRASNSQGSARVA